MKALETFAIHIDLTGVQQQTGAKRRTQVFLLDSWRTEK